MGTYTVQEHMDLFGGMPERGEAAVDINDIVDQQRKAIREGAMPDPKEADDGRQ